MTPAIKIENPHTPGGCEQAKNEYNSWCYHNNVEFLAAAAPSILWFHQEDVGSYQGTVYAVGVKGREIAFYVGYYGSCSGCGAWGEGGEPVTEQDVLNNTKLLSLEDAMAKFTVRRLSNDDDSLDVEYGYDQPDRAKLLEAVVAIKKEIFDA